MIYRNIEDNFRVRAVYFNGKNHDEVAKMLSDHQVKRVEDCIMIDYDKVEPKNYIYTGFDNMEWFVLQPRLFNKKFQKDKWEQEA